MAFETEKKIQKKQGEGSTWDCQEMGSKPNLKTSFHLNSTENQIQLLIIVHEVFILCFSNVRLLIQ